MKRIIISIVALSLAGCAGNLTAEQEAPLMKDCAAGNTRACDVLEKEKATEEAQTAAAAAAAAAIAAGALVATTPRYYPAPVYRACYRNFYGYWVC